MTHDRQREATDDTDRTSGGSRTAPLLVVLVITLGLLWFFKSLVLPTLLGLVGVAIARPVFVVLRSKLGKSVAAALVATGLLAAVSGVIAAVVGLLHLEQEALTQGIRQVEPAIEQLASSGRSMGLPLPRVDKAITGDQVSSWMQSLGLGAGRVVGAFLLAYFLVLLLYLEYDKWSDRIRRAMGEDGPRRVVEVVDRIRGYYLTRSLTCVASALISGAWMWFMDVPSAPLWAVLIGILNYVPTLGSWVGAFPPVVLALTTHGVGTAAAVAGGLFIQEQLVGNLLDPFLQRERVALAPSALLLSVVGATVLLGLPGAFFAGPLVILAIALLRTDARSAPWAEMLQDR